MRGDQKKKGLVFVNFAFPIPHQNSFQIFKYNQFAKLFHYFKAKSLLFASRKIQIGQLCLQYQLIRDNVNVYVAEPMVINIFMKIHEKMLLDIAVRYNFGHFTFFSKVNMMKGRLGTFNFEDIRN